MSGAIDDRAGRVIRQHARTSELLGVDFVPVYRTIGAEAPASAAPSPAAAPPETHARAQQEGARNVKAARLEEIRQRYLAEAPHAPFIASFTNVVFGEGDPAARLMFVGEAPGAEEDRTGRPFVGRAGQLLEKMIIAMGLKRSDVYIANVLKVRPPNNATPTIEEAEASAPVPPRPDRGHRSRGLGHPGPPGHPYPAAQQRLHGPPAGPLGHLHPPAHQL